VKDDVFQHFACFLDRSWVEVDGNGAALKQHYLKCLANAGNGGVIETLSQGRGHRERPPTSSVSQYQPIHFFRVLAGKVHCDPAAQRVPHDNRFGNTEGSHEQIQELHPGLDLVLYGRLVGISEPQLIGNHDVIVRRKRRNVGGPDVCRSAQPVEKNYIPALASLVVVDMLAENLDHLLWGHGGYLSSRQVPRNE